MAGKGGGAWKVAYADFVTAMMAFFLVMWIVAQSDQVKEAIAHHFNDPFARESEEDGTAHQRPPRHPAPARVTRSAGAREGSRRQPFGAAHDAGRRTHQHRHGRPLCRRLGRARCRGPAAAEGDRAAADRQAAKDRGPRPFVAAAAGRGRPVCRPLAALVSALPGRDGRAGEAGHSATSGCDSARPPAMSRWPRPTSSFPAAAMPASR